ncbi:MAG TPA: alpha/beta fold hydrolase [Thermoleophilaceae bacterium]|jgi:pimeloyl-ACP methyl ester carboxylesterase|nr:alpha/beta fold hydrolase [Thermoleophilaceae bacterium]
MPLASNGTIKLHWESAGEGPPVLLIAGQGMTVDAWWATIPVLAESFRVIAFDNRDTGRSTRLPWPYTVAQMAGDAVAVLDAAGARRAHVYGISLGSLVAQEVALRHPDRVDALVLGASSGGGFAAYKPPPSSLAQTFLVRAGTMGAEEAQWAAVPYTYAEKSRRVHAERIATDIAHRLKSPPEPLAYVHQAAAVATHDAYERLNRLAAPTLVVHGEEDVFVPPANALVLAERIPGAELRLWPDAGHMYIVDEPRADQEIARFLVRQTVARSAPDLAAA